MQCRSISGTSKQYLRDSSFYLKKWSGRKHTKLFDTYTIIIKIYTIIKVSTRKVSLFWPGWWFGCYPLAFYSHHPILLFAPAVELFCCSPGHPHCLFFLPQCLVLRKRQENPSWKHNISDTVAKGVPMPTPQLATTEELYNPIYNPTQ